MLLYCVVVFLLPRPVNLKPEGWRLFGIFLATIGGLILEPIPGGALVLAAVTLAALFGGLSATQALSGYGDPVVWLMMAAFFISDALLSTGLARRIALLFMRAVGGSSLGVCYALSFTDMVLASVIPSNSARSGGVVMPIARSVAELHGSYPGPTAALLGSFLMTGVYQSICVTAAMFMTGQASNPLAASIATETLHYPVTLVSWFVAGIVPGLCSMLIVPAVVYRLNPPQIRRTPEARAFAASELARMGRMDGPQRTVFLVFAAVCGLWVTTAIHHIDITITALLGAVALLLSGVLKWEQVAGNKAAWNLFIWYGGLVRLGHALGDAGVTKAFASGVAGMLPGARWMVLLAVVLAIYFYSHYGFASITAHLLSMFVPFGALLIAEGAPPGLVVFSLACFTNLAAGLTHYGTTPAPMFFAQRYVSLREWWKTGFAISLVNLAIWSTIGFAWWKVVKVW